MYFLPFQISEVNFLTSSILINLLIFHRLLFIRSIVLLAWLTALLMKLVQETDASAIASCAAPVAPLTFIYWDLTPLQRNDHHLSDIVTSKIKSVCQ